MSSEKFGARPCCQLAVEEVGYPTTLEGSASSSIESRGNGDPASPSMNVTALFTEPVFMTRSRVTAGLARS